MPSGLAGSMLPRNDPRRAAAARECEADLLIPGVPEAVALELEFGVEALVQERRGLLGSAGVACGGT